LFESKINKFSLSNQSEWLPPFRQFSVPSLSCGSLETGSLLMVICPFLLHRSAKLHHLDVKTNSLWYTGVASSPETALVSRLLPLAVEVSALDIPKPPCFFDRLAEAPCPARAHRLLLAQVVNRLPSSGCTALCRFADPYAGASFYFSFRRTQVSRSSLTSTRTPTDFSTAQQSSRDFAPYPHVGATIISPFAHRSAEAARPARERQLVPVGAAEAGGRGPGGRGLPGHARHAVQPRQDPGLLPRVPQAECEGPLFWFLNVRFMPLLRLVQNVSD
jgi:hypothetical protein